MSLLKRLFGKAPDRQMMPRQPRVPIGQLHRVEFSLPNAKARLINVSVSGMALHRADAAAVKTGDVLAGELTIDAQAFPLVAEVRYASSQAVGCLFQNANEPMRRAIEDYFRIEILALRLRPVSREYMKADPEGEATWYTDGGLNEVYYVVADGQLRRFHLSFLGNYVEGAAGRAVRSGLVAPESSEETRNGFRQGAPLIDLGTGASRQAVELSRQVLRNIEGLPQRDLALLEAQLGDAALAALG